VFEFFDGNLVKKTPTHAVLEVGGIGYLFAIPRSTFEGLPERGRVRLLAHLHVQEDAHRLFGFRTEREREVFRLLTTVSGIGPATALGILSAGPLDLLIRAVAAGDVPALRRLKGVGPKTAERLVVELRDSLALLADGAPQGHRPGHPAAGDAVLALVSLGFNRVAAEKAVRSAGEKVKSDAPLEILVREALQQV
jgi:Holliday junction DNA helicase RuvA